MRAKKIVGIILLTVFTLLACLVVVSAFVPKNFKFPLGEPQSITIYKDGVNQVNIEKDDERYDEIMKLYNQGFNVKFLEAFFQGKGFKKIKTADVYQSLSSLSSKENLIYIEFNYGEEQQTQVLNSNVVLDSNEEHYKNVVIEIKNSNNLVEVNAYIRYGLDSTNGSYIRYVSYARHAKLFDYLDETFNY